MHQLASRLFTIAIPDCAGLHETRRISLHHEARNSPSVGLLTQSGSTRKLAHANTGLSEISMCMPNRYRIIKAFRALDLLSVEHIVGTYNVG